MEELLWYLPVCANIEFKVNHWYNNYETGKIYSTRPFLTKHGEVQNIPTKYANDLVFSKLELDHLLLILNKYLKNKGTLSVIEQIRSNIKTCKLLNNNQYLFTVCLYKYEIKEIIDALSMAKTGVPISIEGIVSEQKKTGKSPFEL